MVIRKYTVKSAKSSVEQKACGDCSSSMLEQYKQTIEALVDGELDLHKKRKILEIIRHVPEMQSYYATLLKQKYALQKWWSHERNNIH
jgi:hypothetical protein